MAFKDVKLQMSKITRQVREIDILNEYSHQLVKAAEDLLKYNDAEIVIKFSIDIDTKQEITEDKYVEEDEIDKFLREMKRKDNKDKDDTKTIEHNIKLNNLSHELGLSLIEHLNNKTKSKIELLEKEIKLTLNKEDEETNSK
jgi:hypothetical protein